MIDWDLPLTSFKFKAREWKFLIEEYKGASWFASLWMGVDPARPPPALEIPSPRLGREFASSEFENRPDDDRCRVSEPPEEEEVTGSPSLRGDGVALLFPPRSDASQRSSRSDRSFNYRVPSPPVERLAPFLQHLDALETRASVLEDSLPTLFLLVRDELDEIWRDLSEGATECSCTTTTFLANPFILSDPPTSDWPYGVDPNFDSPRL